MGAHFLLVFFVRYYLTCKIPPYKNYLTFWEWKETIAPDAHLVDSTGRRHPVHPVLSNLALVAAVSQVQVSRWRKSNAREILPNRCQDRVPMYGRWLNERSPWWLMSSSPELHRSPRLATFQAARVYRPEEHLSPKADCHNWCLTTSLTSGEAMNSTLAMIIRGRLAFNAVSISSGLT